MIPHNKNVFPRPVPQQNITQIEVALLQELENEYKKPVRIAEAWSPEIALGGEPTRGIQIMLDDKLWYFLNWSIERGYYFSKPKSAFSFARFRWGILCD